MKEKVVILGGGESGTGSAVLAAVKGFEVFVSDSGKIKDKYRLLLYERNIPFEEGKHTTGDILDADLVIKSPGIPEKAEIIQHIREKNIPVISEIEFAGRYTDAFKICITGSNGKTTTTNLVYHILKQAGLNVGLAGNIGASFALQVATCSYDYYVIELSSFQLDGMFDFRADIAILMNITPDHLDRYNYRLEEYIGSKFRVVQNQSGDQYFIYWADDPVIGQYMKSNPVKGTLLPFSDKIHDGMAAYIHDDELFLSLHNQTESIMTIHDLALKGRHNTYNSMAAAIAGKILNIKNETIRQCLTDFQGVEHRLETTLTVHGIHFVNDSKATNVNSTWYALECMSTKVVWIAGGIDKGNDYSELLDLAREKVRAIVCLGKDNSKITEAFRDVVPTIVETDNMTEAVKSAYYLASKGDTVLLSPACASFDLFTNYEDRGRQFKDQIRNL